MKSHEILPFRTVSRIWRWVYRSSIGHIVKVCARFQKLQPANHQLQVFQKSKNKHFPFRLFDPTLPYIVSPDQKRCFSRRSLGFNSRHVVGQSCRGQFSPGWCGAEDERFGAEARPWVILQRKVGINKTTRWWMIYEWWYYLKISHFTMVLFLPITLFSV